MVSYKENLFPRQFLHELKLILTAKEQKLASELNEQSTAKNATPPNIRILPYAKGTPLFSDRNYEDELGSKSLEPSYVVQLPRHLDANITLMASEKIIIYRLLSDDNDNQIFSDWNLTEIPVLVNGASSKHTKVVSKAFNSGEIELSSGGPVCSSPVLVKQVTATDSICPFRIK
tara:strand:+ start:106 stop:627 length:522 start_codon:yes stop_codon:yes gene_type:complete